MCLAVCGNVLNPGNYHCFAVAMLVLNVLKELFVRLSYFFCRRRRGSIVVFSFALIVVEPQSPFESSDFHRMKKLGKIIVLGDGDVAVRLQFFDYFCQMFL